MKKHILMLATGGTIASRPNGNGLEPSFTIADLLRFSPDITKYYDIDAKDILHLDSSNIQPEEWVLIARSIYYEHAGYDGVVVTHGTDTMAYTASVLTFMLSGLDIPVVVTGSQLPYDNPLSDGPENLRYALAVAASGTPGVFIAFSRKIILGCRAVKVRTTGFDAFESVNFPDIAVGSGGGMTLRSDLLTRPRGEFRLLDNLCSDVFLIKLTPGFNPAIFDMLLGMDYKGIVIEAFGAGGLHYIHRDLISRIKKLVDSGIPVVVSSQCLYERSDFSLYEVGQRVLDSGAIQAGDMTTEAVVTKLMWALGQTRFLGDIRTIFGTNFAGEVTL